MFLHRQSLGLTYTGLIDDLQINVRMKSFVDVGGKLTAAALYWEMWAGILASFFVLQGRVAQCVCGRVLGYSE